MNADKNGRIRFYRRSSAFIGGWFCPWGYNGRGHPLTGGSMIIGVPTEIKDHESRVGLVPAGVHALVEANHRVRVQQGAGNGSAITDSDYVSAGAEIVSAAEAWGADMVVKVKEPLPPE